MAKTPKREKHISPKGAFSWPKLTVPDTKFKPEGEYSVKLILDSDSADCKRLIKLIDAAAAESLAESKANAKNAAEAKKWETKSVPYAEVLDEETGDPTGQHEFTFKMTASGTSKKTGKDWKRQPALFDAKGKPLTGKNLKIGGGTIGKVSFELMKWGTLQLGASVKLALEGVQIIDLKEWGSRDAKSFGFGEEEGFSGDDLEDEAEDSSDFGDESGNEDSGNEDEDIPF